MMSIVQQVASEQHDTLIEHTLAGIQHYHSSPIDAAEVANQAGIKLPVMSHLTPPPSNLLCAAHRRGLAGGARLDLNRRYRSSGHLS
jgi:ribonuclease BN (tRNA processing enzyme)